MKKRFFYLLPLFILQLLVVCSCKDDNNEPTLPEPSPEITIPSSENLNPVLSQEGGTVSISFTTTSDWTASLVNTRAESWITITPNSGTKGKNEITIITTANETYDERNATVVLKCGTVSKNIIVAQKQKDALTVTSSKYEVDGEGGNISVEVKANINFEVEIKADWIKQQTEKTRALTTSNLNFTIEPNETGDKREGEIIIKSGELSETVKVYQGFGDFITLTKKDFTIPEEGGNVDIEIKSTLDYEVKMLNDVDWIMEIQSRAVSTHTHHYTISPNDTYDSREVKIVFYNPKDENVADTVSIYQMYKGAILVARNEYQFGIDGGTLNLAVQTNLEFDVEVSDSWIQQVQPTRALTGYSLSFTISENAEQKDREGTITIKDKNSDKKQVITIKQSNVDMEREVLIAFYKMTNGDGWKNNSGWCSEKPISSWYGVSTDEKGRVTYIDLGRNNLIGRLPENIGNLKKLRYLRINDNYLYGELPESFYDLTELECFNAGNHNFGAEGGTIIIDPSNPAAPTLGRNQLSGEISEKIGNLKKLYEFNAIQNCFTGELPKAIWTLTNLQVLILTHNHNTETDEYLYGELPEEIGNLKNLRQLWLEGNKFSGKLPEALCTLRRLEELHLNDNDFSGELPEEIGNLKSLRELNLSYNLFTGELPKSFYDLTELRSVDFSGTSPGGSTITWADGTYELRNSNSFSGEIFKGIEKLKNLDALCISRNNFTGEIPKDILETLKDLRIIYLLWNRFSGVITKEMTEARWYDPIIILNQQEGYGFTFECYNSTDFSTDGEVLTLQNHTKGKGIKLVLMGDAFVDTDMDAGGKYETMMKNAMENYFSVEPFKSLREYYDVVCIKAVSKNYWIGKETAFEVRYGDGTYIGGNNDKCMEYAQKALGINSIDDVQVITVLNDSKYAGTCHMYSNGFSIAYCPYVYNSDQSFGEMIHHEANGHGFGFLGDEYAYERMISQEEKNSVQESYANNGWYANIDFTSNPSQVKWSHFIKDSRYTNEGIGVYEGGLTYSQGVYRPTETSIMVDNTGQFNAPSREAIYKRAMKIANGNSWVYNYEDFVSFDAPARTATRSIKHYQPRKDFKPTVPPVIYNYPAAVK